MKPPQSTDTKICYLICRANLKPTAFQKMQRIWWVLLLCLVLSKAIEAATINVPADYSTIQAAINASFDGDEIIVSPGTYYENINFSGKNISLRSTDPTNPSIVASTIIDASSSGTVVTFSGTESPDCVLSGFTITNGGLLGGCYGNGTWATIENNKIVNNSGTGVSNCDGAIHNNTISNNARGLYGCDGTVQSNTISGNSNTWHGGGFSNCQGIILNNIISGNSAPYGGGFYQCNGTLHNNIITSNTADYGGGLCGCQGTIQNNTIYGNSAGSAGGGLSDCWFPGTIQNCIIWQNTAPSAAQVCSCDSLNYNCIQDWPFTNGGNISDSPQLADPANGDFHLQSNSPCIDAGCYISDLAEDFEGDPRPFNGTPEPRGDGSDFDIGADEYLPTQTAISPKIWSLYP